MPILRLIRLPLLFCFLADASVVVFLCHAADSPWPALKAVWIASMGLYLFATAGNDVADARRDQASPSPGRINPVAAGQVSLVIAAGLTAIGGVVAVTAAVASDFVNVSTTLGAMGIIVAYNVGAKRFPPLGLMLLGLFRAANASGGLTGADVLHWWAVPAIIAAHTIAVCAFAYAWERRRPLLYGNNWFHLLALAAAALAGLGIAAQRSGAEFWPADYALTKVVLAWGLFVVVFFAIFGRTAPTQRGGVLRFFGLNWLILLDAAFILAAGQSRPGWIYLACLGAVIVSVRLMRFGASAEQRKA